ncbi:sugar ABC transporter permease [Treponema primitia ZAS-2]|uniref:sn-glycerol-3-phosphate transport system permease protein UgpE n=1 Tax=Treponema primitia (strain ATCC BAA-887 / DSM 12427 / ZAS-2) TaxID=545694 RepID=F5YQ55_TREPZ|nr:carbohydrate ABC transporter permease [Treponema primitia]AEF85611.1 sugar ABC transporter permease [Treponema primitia ZAS-2]
METPLLRKAPLNWRIAAYFLMVAFAVLTIFPLVWLGYSSLKPHAEIVLHPLRLPQHPSLNNYFRAWELGNLGTALLNSFIYTIVATVATLFLSLAAAFGIVKFHFKSSAFFTAAFAVGLMITVHAVIIPLFLAEVKVGIINRRIGVILPYIAFDLPMSVMIAISYIRGIPDALIESAEMDGAKYRHIFWAMIVPLSTPVIATMVILSFLRHWNEFLFVFIFTTKASMKSLPVAITLFAGRNNIEYGMQYAALVIGIIPMIIFYFFFHAQLIKGFGEGALKE